MNHIRKLIKCSMFKISSVVVILAITSGCSQKSGNVQLGFAIANPAVSSQKSGFLEETRNLIGTFFEAESSKSNQSISEFAPYGATGFDCYFVNVMGSDIGDWKTHKNKVNSSADGSGYYGIVSSTISSSTGGKTTVDVPTGTDRIVQVLGVRKGASLSSCPTTISETDLTNSTSFPGIFEIGRTVQDTLQDSSIFVKNTYDATSAKDFRYWMRDKLVAVDIISPVTAGVIEGTGTATTVALNWTAATDNGTSPENLRYKVVQASSVSELSTVAKADLATVVADWTEALTSTTASGLSDGVVYAFAVLVKDAGGNISLYSPITVTTLDVTSPVVGSAIIFSSQASTSVTVNWGVASDNSTATSDLLYKVVRSTSSNISTVANAEANGTTVMNWVANTLSVSATDLADSTGYYFAVLVKDSAGNKALYTPALSATSDATAPTVGTSIAISSIAATSVTASWGVASDNATAAASLSYKLVKSSSNNLTTVTNAESNGTTVMDWATNTLTYGVTGLSDSTLYYLAVIVKDSSGNKSLYTPVSVTTADATVPTAGTGITFASVAATSLTANWGAGSDNTTSAANLSYKLVRSTSNNLSTVANAEANGTLTMDWTTNTLTKAVTGLTAGLTYYFAAIVKDQAGNKSLYTPQSVSTSDTTAPTVGTAVVVSGSGTVRTSIFEGTTTLSWGAATDNASVQSALQYKLVKSMENSAIDSVSEISSCAAPCSVVMDWTTNTTTSGTISGLSTNTVYYFSVAVKDEAGNMSAYTPLEVDMPGFIARASSSGLYVVASHAVSTNDVVVEHSDSSASFSQYGGNVGSNISDAGVTIDFDSNGDLWLATQKAECSWVSDTLVYKYASSAWSQIGSFMGGSSGHCTDGSGVSHSGTFYPSIHLSGTTPYVMAQASVGYWTTLAWAYGSSWTTQGANLGNGELAGGVPAWTHLGSNLYAFSDFTSNAKVKKFASGAWSNVGTFGVTTAIGEATGGPGERIAVASNGDLYVAYRDAGTSKKVSVKHYNGSSWSQVGSAGISAGEGEQVSIVLVEDVPYVLYKDAPSGGDAVLKHWDSGSSAWVTTSSGVFGEEVIFPVMRFDAGTGDLNVYGVKKSDLTRSTHHAFTVAFAAASTTLATLPSGESSIYPGGSLDGTSGAFFFGGNYYQGATGSSKYLIKINQDGALDTTFGTNGWQKLSLLSGGPSFSSTPYWQVCNGNVYFAYSGSGGYDLYRLNLGSSPPTITNLGVNAPSGGGAFVDFVCVNNKLVLTFDANPSNVYISAYDTNAGTIVNSGAITDSGTYMLPFADATGNLWVYDMNSNNTFVEFNASLGIAATSTINSGNAFVDGGVSYSTNDLLWWTRNSAHLKLWTGTATNFLSQFHSGAVTPNIDYVSTSLNSIGAGIWGEKVCRGKNKYFAYVYGANGSSVYKFAGFVLNTDGTLSSAFNSGAELNFNHYPYNYYTGRYYLTVTCDDTNGRAVFAYQDAAGKIVVLMVNTN